MKNVIPDRKKRYKTVISTLDAFIGPGGYNMTEIGRMATICSVLAIEFREWIFTGFYRVVASDMLEIGPYQGRILACGKIKFGRGVCGTSAESGKTVIVDNVSEFPGYIACDSETVSEIVVPVFKNGTLTAVLDIDSGQSAAFDKVDKKYLEIIVTYC